MNPTYEKICLIDESTIGQLNVDRKLLDCSNLCFNKSINPKIDLNRNSCVISCEESEFKYEYNNICYERCPENTSPSNNNEYLCLDSNSEGYYFDLEENIYKECYKTCKYCYGEGNETNDNCSECKPNYIFLNLSNDINCYNKCEHYYYRFLIFVLNHLILNSDKKFY